MSLLENFGSCAILERSFGVGALFFLMLSHTDYSPETSG